MLRLETYIADADLDRDIELADFFRKAQAESRKGAEQGKQMLKVPAQRITHSPGPRPSRSAPGARRAPAAG